MYRNTELNNIWKILRLCGGLQLLYKYQFFENVLYSWTLWALFINLLIRFELVEVYVCVCVCVNAAHIVFICAKFLVFFICFALRWPLLSTYSTIVACQCLLYIFLWGKKEIKLIKMLEYYMANVKWFYWLVCSRTAKII